MNQLPLEQDAVIRFVLFRTMTALFSRRRHTHVASAVSVGLNNISSTFHRKRTT